MLACQNCPMEQKISRYRIAAASAGTLLGLAACAGGAPSGLGSGPLAIVPAAHAKHAASRQKLYISNIDGSVLVYSTGSAPTLLQTITDGVPRPSGVWVDNRGVFYAVNIPGPYYQTSLPEYKPGATTPFQTITDGIVNVSTVAVDGSFNVYVTGVNTKDGSFFLEVYPKGKLSPSETLTIPEAGHGAGGPTSLAFDSTGALLVGETIDDTFAGAVFRLPKGSQTFTNLNLHDAPGGSIAVDGAGNLYVGGNGIVRVYAPNSKRSNRRIYLGAFISGLTADASGDLYVGVQTEQETIMVYPPGAKKPSQSFSVEALIGGLALSQ